MYIFARRREIYYLNLITQNRRLIINLLLWLNGKAFILCGLINKFKIKGGWDSFQLLVYYFKSGKVRYRVTLQGQGITGIGSAGLGYPARVRKRNKYTYSTTLFSIYFKKRKGSGGSMLARLFERNFTSVHPLNNDITQFVKSCLLTINDQTYLLNTIIRIGANIFSSAATPQLQ